MVPLFREADIAERLLRRLERLTYPRELTDVVLVCEEDDALTTAAVRAAALPSWIRIVTVPRGDVQTKPRALNYALDFCRGQFIGVWDAEDAPAPDQLHRVARRFHERGPEVACLQGALDYYNTRTNWLSRCFTLEYAAWFHVMLPGLQSLGFALPLGGTTLYFRRAALESLGGWDAHNVTEDADLGIRLYRHGWRTEMVETVTGEEANCRPVPWIKQRSRWLKGYAVTWAVHMRNPGRLWRDLGPRRFFGFQILFLGSLSQTALAPVLWACWALAFGGLSAVSGVLPTGGWVALVALFLGAEAISMLAALLGSRAAGKPWLWPWVPTMGLYFPLAAIAIWRAMWELVGRPFLWHKTAHGLFDIESSPAELETDDPTDQLAASTGPAALAHYQTVRVDKGPTIDAGPHRR